MTKKKAKLLPNKKKAGKPKRITSASVIKALNYTKGDTHAAARLIGITQAVFKEHMKKHKVYAQNGRVYKAGKWQRPFAPKRAKKKARKKRAWSEITIQDIEVWRSKLGLSKVKMADHLGVTNSTYHNWMKGKAVATINTQVRIKAMIGNGTSGPSYLGTVTQGDPTDVRLSKPTDAGGAWQVKRAQDSWDDLLGNKLASATGEVVAAHLDKRQTPLSEDEVVIFVGRVRTALAGERASHPKRTASIARESRPETSNQNERADKQAEVIQRNTKWRQA